MISVCVLLGDEKPGCDLQGSPVRRGSYPSTVVPTGAKHRVQSPLERWPSSISAGRPEMESRPYECLLHCDPPKLRRARALAQPPGLDGLLCPAQPSRPHPRRPPAWTPRAGLERGSASSSRKTLASALPGVGGHACTTLAEDRTLSIAWCAVCWGFMCLFHKRAKPSSPEAGEG